ncbi:hypothetical protein LINGRAHAP2_LOCUS29533 [Linum grandiflorum]
MTSPSFNDFLFGSSFSPVVHLDVKGIGVCLRG